MLKCPFCSYEGTPVFEKRISSTGWVLFVVLLFFCLPLFWIPFVVDGTKEEVRKCARCGSRLG
ncbi:LITAF-like zinc ribbon domain-containing protein [Natronoflexus pectinivorans]|uniref:LITAF-like zinc ribbon domain-containing protein n=1 Tax=Natronoflexus pectinivorans TaxID=682526 RepID=UPI001A9CEC6C